MAKSTDEEVWNSQLRHELVETALSFLTNPRIANRSEQEKREFLDSKGLTEDEILESFRRATISTITATRPQPVSDHSFLGLLARLSGNLLFVTAVSYSAVHLWRNYISPFLSPAPAKRQQTADETSENLTRELHKTILQLHNTLDEFHAVLVQQKSETSAVAGSDREVRPGDVAQIKDMKEELTQIKSLLLARSQFPTAPSPSALLGASGNSGIPSWQMKRQDGGDVASAGADAAGAGTKAEFLNGEENRETETD